MAQFLQLKVLHNHTMWLCQDTGWRMSLQVDPHSPDLPIIAVHTLALAVYGQGGQPKRLEYRTQRLPVESLLVHTITLRTRARLTEL